MTTVGIPKNMPIYEANSSNDQRFSNTKTCNCRVPSECPVDNKCLTSNVIYLAEVNKYSDNNELIKQCSLHS